MLFIKGRKGGVNQCLSQINRLLQPLNTVYSSVKCTVQYTVQCIVECTVQCKVQCTGQCTEHCTAYCSVHLYGNLLCSQMSKMTVTNKSGPSELI